MKIGVISDTHIPAVCEKLPPEIEKYFKGTSLILHAGDLVDEAVLEELKKYAKTVEAVCGNMDEVKLKTTLPKKRLITVGKYKIGLIHGEGAPEILLEYVSSEFKSGVDAIVFGHSHKPCNFKKNGVLFFNPGSPTDKTFTKYNSIGILEINDKIKGQIIKL